MCSWKEEGSKDGGSIIFADTCENWPMASRCVQPCTATRGTSKGGGYCGGFGGNGHGGIKGKWWP